MTYVSYLIDEIKCHIINFFLICINFVARCFSETGTYPKSICYTALFLLKATFPHWNLHEIIEYFEGSLEIQYIFNSNILYAILTAGKYVLYLLLQVEYIFLMCKIMDVLLFSITMSIVALF